MAAGHGAGVLRDNLDGLWVPGRETALVAELLSMHSLSSAALAGNRLLRNTLSLLYDSLCREVFFGMRQSFLRVSMKLCFVTVGILSICPNIVNHTSRIIL
jgi:hypothetical protein